MASEYQKLRAAYGDFYQIYEALPGDLDNAYSLFGSACGTDDLIVNGGCNGDGDESVEDVNESYKSNQHMNLAQLFDEEYSGSALIGTVDEKFVKSKFTNGYYSPILDAANQNNLYRARFDRFHYIVLGAINLSNEPYNPLFTADEANKIDSKIDDGVMWNGVVQIRYNDAQTCNGGDAVLAGNYILDDENIICNLLFYIDVFRFFRPFFF